MRPPGPLRRHRACPVPQRGDSGAPSPANRIHRTLRPHEDPDLQLQPDLAAGRPGAEARPGQDPRRQHRWPGRHPHPAVPARGSHFQRAAKETTASGDELLVACTQESRLFLELNQETEGAAGVQERPIRFVNIRETAGWSQKAVPGHAQDRRAAGRGPVAGAGRRCPPWLPQPGAAWSSARPKPPSALPLLGDKLDVSLLLAAPARWRQAHDDGRAQRPPDAADRLAGAVRGRVGKPQPHRPGPVHPLQCLRRRLPRRRHRPGLPGGPGTPARSTATACGCATPPAPSTSAAKPLAHEETFDLVLDLRSSPAFSQHQLPQGYFHPGADERALVRRRASSCAR
jgi:hypothetical protein